MNNLSKLLRFTPSNYRNPNTLISVIIIIATIANFLLACRNNLHLESYHVTEFMIKFQGGFVRRGAVGEIFYQFISATGFPICTSIFLFCSLCYVSVLAFFFVKFKQREYCWWLILCPFFLGMNLDFIRKDFLLYINFIAIVFALSGKPTSIRKIIATTIAVWSIFIHEAFIFFGGAFTIFLLISENKKSILNWSLVATIVFSFLLNSYFKGSVEIASAIRDSWNALPNINLSNATDNSIGAIGWTTKEAVITHIKVNFLSFCWLGFFFQPMNIVFSYYIITTFLTVFKGANSTYSLQQRNSLSGIYILALFCLLPMFTILSCDYARLYQYASVIALTCFIILPTSQVEALIPSFLSKIVYRINVFIDTWLTPNKVTIVAVLLFIGQSPYGFHPEGFMRTSIWGSLAAALFNLAIYSRDAIVYILHHV